MCEVWRAVLIQQEALHCSDCPAMIIQAKCTSPFEQHFLSCPHLPVAGSSLLSNWPKICRADSMCLGLWLEKPVASSAKAVSYCSSSLMSDPERWP